MSDSDLDPRDWREFGELRDRVLSDLTDFVRHVEEGPVWRRPTARTRAHLEGGPPLEGQALDAIWEETKAHLLPHLTGNLHPRFFGWAHGAGTPAGALAEAVAGFLNANLAGRDQAPVLLERQVLGWFRELFDFPSSSSGVLLSGTSMANLVGLVVAREAVLESPREAGPGGVPRIYMSRAAHLSARRAVRILGLPEEALVLVETDRAGRVRADRLARAVDADRADGHRPLAIVGTAGTAGTGAVDPLDALAEIAEASGLWLHVDGAFGAVAYLSPDRPPGMEGIRRADSLAFDFHKWLHVPYSVGCLLVRDAAAHRAAFEVSASYADLAAGELGGGRPWPTEYGPEMSRGFRALKVWWTVKHFGVERLVRQMDRNRSQARELASMVEAHPDLEMGAPVALNVVCFRYLATRTGPDFGDRLQEAIVERVQASGVAAPSAVSVDGRTCIRAAIFNHRTTTADLRTLCESVVETGRSVERERSAAAPNGSPR